MTRLPAITPEKRTIAPTRRKKAPQGAESPLYEEEGSQRRKIIMN